MRGHYLYLLSVLLGLAVVGQPSGSAYQQHPPAAGSTVGFDLYHDYLIVAKGSAGPLKGLNFLLDTGANPTVLDSRVARRLHLDVRPESIAVLDGSVQAGKAIVPSLKFGSIRRDNFSALIVDLSFLQKAIPVRIDGMIGIDVLGQSAFEIDYTAREIHFGQIPSLAVSLPLRVEGGLPIVDAELNHVSAHLLVDTGASSLILFEPRTPSPVSDLKISAVQRPADQIGEFEHKQARLRSLRLGQAEFGQEPALLADDRRTAGQDFDGLISPAVLGITKIAIDLERGVLSFSR